MHVKVLHTVNQLLTLSHNLLKISLFKLHTSSQIRVPLVNCWVSFYSAAALLAMQNAVIPTAIPSVCLSVCHTLVLYPDE